MKLLLGFSSLVPSQRVDVMCNVDHKFCKGVAYSTFQSAS
jgi:hypothetical protein